VAGTRQVEKQSGVIYKALRWLTGIALHWFYSDIRLIGHERIPLRTPVILAASHHNALVDCLVAGWLIPRRITITAKATLRDNKFVAALFALVGVIPLRRTSDELQRARDGVIDRNRNTEAFDNILNSLEKNGAVLIFPEGKSHSEPALAPLKTGAARMALAARDTRHVSGIQIVPLGLNFEDKGTPRSSVVAEVGEVIDMDSEGVIGVEELTSKIERRLRAVSLKPFTDYSRNRDRPLTRTGLKALLVSAAAAWGEFTHRDVIRVARELAIRKSKTPDDPAMLTILYGLFFILASYALQLSVLWIVAGFWWAAAYLATLPIGAYWAAFKDHPAAIRVPLVA
jgi:1-acyl-sn-glycerol-3-phosphate acyltransferase